MSTNTKEELDSKSAVAVRNFLAVYEKHPQRARFRTAMFNLQNLYPSIWLSVFSDDEQERADAVKWLKQRHNSLAAKLGMELLK